MNMRINPTGGDDHAFAGNNFGRPANRHRHARLYIGVTGFADGSDETIF